MMQQIVDEFKSKGSPITEEDFRSYESKVRKDEDVIYVDLGNGIRGCGPPPVSLFIILQITVFFSHLARL